MTTLNITYTSIYSIIALYFYRWRDSLVFHSEYNTLDAIFGSISQEEKPTVSGQLVESFIRPFPAPDTENSRATGIPNPGTFIEEVLADDATITAFGFAHFGIGINILSFAVYRDFKLY